MQVKLIRAIALCLVAYVFVYAANPQDELTKSIARGKELYNETCITCHMGNGMGMPPNFPPLAKADYVTKTPEKSLYAVKFGLKDPITVNGKTYNMAMPNPGLADEEVADVMNYIQNSWGNVNKKMVTGKMVEAVKK